MNETNSAGSGFEHLIIKPSPDERNTLSFSKETLQAATRLMAEDGVLVLADVIDVQAVHNARKEFFAKYWTMPSGDDAPARFGQAVGHRRSMVALDFSGAMGNHRIFASPFCKSILSDLLGPQFVIAGYLAVCSLPGARAQRVHRDHPLLFPKDPTASYSLPPYCLTLVIPLVDVDLTNGVTATWPGSHKGDSALSAGASPDRAFCPTVKIGSAYLMDYRLQHCGLANMSDQPRPIITLNFSRGWFIDHANMQPRPKISAHDLSSIPDEHRHLFAQISYLHPPG
ncbi:phytanoyl-CoA dioxygenase family protein [Streptomyces sp. NPDC099088]|uniref:phytanoyl-CoA dioxygenase family protein n=1 Tax=Streptomyces sp. NPDC099088 TaxID=3366101 RepID=UPI0037F87D56